MFSVKRLNARPNLQATINILLISQITIRCVNLLRTNMARKEKRKKMSTAGHDPDDKHIHSTVQYYTSTKHLIGKTNQSEVITSLIEQQCYTLLVGSTRGWIGLGTGGTHTKHKNRYSSQKLLYAIPRVQEDTINSN